jgi:raffinose/stachyose/melibiose transport system permease protein
MPVSKTEARVNYVILAFFSAIAVVPLLVVLLTALRPSDQVASGFAFPESLTLGNFNEAWQRGHFETYMRASVIVSVSVVLLTVTLSTLAGYAFGLLRFAGRDLIFYGFVIGIVIPFESLIIPLYYNLRSLGLTESYLALILPETALLTCFGTFWMRAFFRSVPRNLIEAARLDGANSFTVLWRILVPIGLPALSTLAVLTFMWSWNEFLLPVILAGSESLRTAPLGLSFFQTQYLTDTTGLAAASVIVALPIVMVFLLFQRSFIRGVLSGSLKA